MGDTGKWIFRIVGIVFLILIIRGCIVGNKKQKEKEAADLIEYPTDGWVKRYYSVFDRPTNHKSDAYYYRTAFYRNGQLVKDSLITEFSADGEKREGFYLKSENPEIKDGPFYHYWKGKVTSKGTYVNGKRQGPYYGYGDRGNITFKSYYENDKLEGKVYRYLDNGKYSSIETYVNGMVNGPCEFYDENGRLSAKGNFIEVRNKDKADYSKGQTGISIVPSSGEYVSYYPNGKVRAKGQYQNMKQVGIWYYYDERGNRTSKDYTPKPVQTMTYQQPQRSRNDAAYDRGYERGWDAGYEDAVNGNGFQASWDCNGGGPYLSGYEDGYQDGWDNGRAERRRNGDEDEDEY